MRHLIKYSVSLMLMMLAALTTQAQDENAAFYIYQNDGHFDGFFYDEVQKISYSFLDTLGIEHDEVVSQEIVTTDSIYRIMLTAIDSIGFVQPEIKLNPRLQDCQRKGMLDYLVSKDLETLRFTFSTDMPESIRPREGDILADYDPDEGWGGKVHTVTVQSDGILVECDPLTSFKDIFERYVTVEEYAENSAGQMVRRRVAGRPELTVGDFSRKMSPRRADHSVEFDFFKFSVTGHYPLYTDASGDKNITIDATAEVATSVKAVWNFDVMYYFSVATTFETSAKLGFTADYKFRDIFPANLDEIGKLYIPTVAPIFYVKLAPDLFFRGDCHMNFNMTTPELRGKFWIKVEVIDDFTSPYVYFKKLKPRDEQEQKEEDESNRWSGAVEFNGFVQMGVKEEFAFGTNKIVSWFVDGKIDATTFIGPKLSGALNLSFSNAIQDQLSVYNVAKDSKLSLNPLAVDYQSEAEVKTLFGQKKKVTLAEGSLDLFPGLNGFDIYAFPEFSLDIETGKNDAGNTTVTATVRPSRNLIWPVDYGAGVFNADNEMVDFCWGTEIGVQMYGMLEMNYPKDEQFVHTFTVTGPGKYTVRPIFKIGDCDIVAAPAKDFTVVVPPTLELASEQLFVTSEGGSNLISVSTNVKTLSLTSSASWLSASYDADNKVLIVKTGKNTSQDSREGIVTVKAENSAGSLTRKVTVKQQGEEDNEKEKLWKDVNFTNFTMDGSVTFFEGRGVGLSCSGFGGDDNYVGNIVTSSGNDAVTVEGVAVKKNYRVSSSTSEASQDSITIKVRLDKKKEIMSATITKNEKNESRYNQTRHLYDYSQTLTLDSVPISSIRIFFNECYWPDGTVSPGVVTAAISSSLDSKYVKAYQYTMRETYWRLPNDYWNNPSLDITGTLSSTSQTIDKNKEDVKRILDFMIRFLEPKQTGGNDQ